MASPTPIRAAIRTARLVRPNHQSPRACHRHFHSYDYPAPPSPFSKTEAALLRAAYAHVPEHGFTTQALGLGARDAGLLDISPAVLPDGPFSLIRWHLVAQREALKGKSQSLLDREDAPKGVGGKVVKLTWERLMGNKEVIHRWQEALAVMAQPSYVPASLKELALLSDEIWYLAGDTAVDPSWYTKRATLSMVYSTTELFMTNDTSPDFVETQKFMQRRLGEVRGIGTTFSSIGQWAGFTFNAGINVLRSKGARI